MNDCASGRVPLHFVPLCGINHFFGTGVKMDCPLAKNTPRALRCCGGGALGGLLAPPESAI